MLQGVTTRGTAAQLAVAGAADRRQDRHDQRRARQLVHGLDARHHHRHLRRLRRAAHPGARQHGDRQRQRRADLRAHRPARSSRASRRPRSASRPACAWSSGPTRAARSTRSSSPAPSPAPATVARWSTDRRAPFRAWTPPARARSRPAAPSVRAFPARARRTKTVTARSAAEGARSALTTLTSAMIWPSHSSALRLLGQDDALGSKELTTDARRSPSHGERDRGVPGAPQEASLTTTVRSSVSPS